MKCYICEREIGKKDSLFSGSLFSEENNDGNRSNHKSPSYIFCVCCLFSITNKFHIQPERSKREDLECIHKNDTKEYRDKKGYCFDPLCKTCKDAVL